MPYEKSCGAVVFREKNGKREYLLLHYEAGHWGFPKGNQEKNEKEEETAKREIKEETNLEKIEIIPKFKHKISYFYKREGKTIFKEVVFFLAKVIGNEKVKLSYEHISYKWLPYEEALKQITFNEEKELLKRAEEFLKGLKK